MSRRVPGEAACCLRLDGAAWRRPASHLERVSLDQDDNLESGASSKGVAVRHLLAAPALLLQRVAHDVRRPAEAWVEVERHVGPGLDAAATGEVHLEPGRQPRAAAGTTPTHVSERDLCRSPVGFRRHTSLDQNHFSRTESTQDGPCKRERLWGEQADVQQTCQLQSKRNQDSLKRK